MRKLANTVSTSFFLRVTSRPKDKRICLKRLQYMTPTKHIWQMVKNLNFGECKWLFFNAPSLDVYLLSHSTYQS